MTSLKRHNKHQQYNERELRKIDNYYAMTGGGHKKKDNYKLHSHLIAMPSDSH